MNDSKWNHYSSKFQFETLALKRLLIFWIQGYENAAVTIDELPPPFTEEESKSDKVNNTSSETSTVDNTPTVIVIPTTNEGPNCSSA